jgi:hypothetical protein
MYRLMYRLMYRVRFTPWDTGHGYTLFFDRGCFRYLDEAQRGSRAT